MHRMLKKGTAGFEKNGWIDTEILGVIRQTITNIENGTGKLKWSLFLATMFIFSLDHNILEYLKNMDICHTLS